MSVSTPALPFSASVEGFEDAQSVVFAAPGPFTVPRPTGEYALMDVPPGPARVHVWHPRFPPTHAEVDLAPDTVTALTQVTSIGEHQRGVAGARFTAEALSGRALIDLVAVLPSFVLLAVTFARCRSEGGTLPWHASACHVPVATESGTELEEQLTGTSSGRFRKAQPKGKDAPKTISALKQAAIDKEAADVDARMRNTLEATQRKSAFTLIFLLLIVTDISLAAEGAFDKFFAVTAVIALVGYQAKNESNNAK